MSYGIRPGGFGQPGERETTRHGVAIDITVPTLRLQRIILCDEAMIAAALLALPIGATLLDVWVFPVFAAIIAAGLLRTAFEDVETPQDVMATIMHVGLICIAVFVVGALLRNPIAERLQQGADALWQWPPKIGLFLERVIFVVLPFFVPIFRRVPLLIDYFKTTLRDPTWPSPRTARDIEGVQSPHVYNDEPERPGSSVAFPIMSLLRKNKRTAKIAIDDWFSPKKDDDGLGKFGQAILEGAATFSEKGSKKTSKNPKLGALYFGYTQNEYVRLRQIGEQLELVEKSGVGYKLTDKGERAMVSAIIQTLGIDAVPDDYLYLV